MTFRTRGFAVALVFLVALAAYSSISGRLAGGSAAEDNGSGQILVPLSGVNGYDLILDVSPNATQYIPGAINLNYVEFFDQDKRLKPASELAGILGDAGLSRDDSVLVYGECLPCGGGPSAATYTYWIMKYLGQRKVGMLNGEISDWAAAGLPTEKAPAVRPRSEYRAETRPELLSTYELVTSNQSQIVDARTPQDRSVGSIPGSISIPYDAVLDKSRLKDRSALGLLFSGLRKDKSVVVYSGTGVKASMLCFALELLGYNASLYTWNDWLAHNSSVNISRPVLTGLSQNTTR